jgi:hypothetical protein
MTELMKKGFGLCCLCVLISSTSVVRADNPGEAGRPGRYQMFSNPHANRIYVLDTQTGRLFQLATYKDLNKEILEEIPYAFGSNQLCTPIAYEAAQKSCANKNLEYLKEYIENARQQKVIAAPAPDLPPPPRPK